MCDVQNLDLKLHWDGGLPMNLTIQNSLGSLDLVKILFLYLLRFFEFINFVYFYDLTPKMPWRQKLVDCSLSSLCEEFLFFSIFSFRQANYIFHKLLKNSKHVKF
jgi:hypothetical protein